uniref:WD repeat domain 4 n=1 Tax=Tetraodon nigroviridis TaxID=99883 RepID=H3CF47_TETNG
FVFDCSSAERKPKSSKDENSGAAEETGSDRILAFCTSPSGKLLALTDDSKRLVLLTCEPSWRRLSTRRFVARRSTSLHFTNAEDELLVADKSGDVYPFSVADAGGGELLMGHLSMLLAVTTSPDDRYIITADRDEKIRVSHRACPYNIRSFCLGHQQFVSALLVPPTHPCWLLSGSGDGTIKLWDYERGRRLQSCDITAPETLADLSFPRVHTVSRVCGSADGRLVAVVCERVSVVHFFTLRPDGEHRLVPHSRLPLPHCPLDLTFDPEGRLWVLLDREVGSAAGLHPPPVVMWLLQVDPEDSHLTRVTEVFREHWETLEAALRTSARLEHLQKESFDNVAAYLQKKQQRLAGQQKRAGPPGAGALKRAKMAEAARLTC